MNEAQASFDYDLAVVGGGSGGYAAARTAVGSGLRVAVIDGATELGGLCILRGCMPTKSLLYAAELRHLCRQAAAWGVQAGPADFSFEQVMARKDALIKEFADYRRQQLVGGAFDLIQAQARFTGPHTLALSDGRGLSARSFVVATGSIVCPPPVPGLAETGFITSDEALNLDRPPRSLIVLGGGPVAVELAQFFARFGTHVTVVQRSEHILKEADADAASELESAFRREGMTVCTGTQLLGASRGPDGKTVQFRYQGEVTSVTAEEILFALGRQPNTANLGLEAAGVAMHGLRIVTNEKMQTNVPHIYAAGDCTSQHEIVHLAVQQGEVAGHNIARPFAPRRMDERLLVSVVFTDPHVATVGLTEKAATARNMLVLSAKYPFNDHGKSIIMNVKEGFVKLLADPGTGEILGGCCVGPQGGELIHEIVACMAKRMNVQELAAMPHYHPTLAEIWTYPAEELAGLVKHLA